MNLDAKSCRDWLVLYQYITNDLDLQSVGIKDLQLAIDKTSKQFHKVSDLGPHSSQFENIELFSPSQVCIVCNRQDNVYCLSCFRMSYHFSMAFTILQMKGVI